MTFKEMENLLKLISELEMTEFKMKDGEFELIVRTKEYNKNRRIETFTAPPSTNIATQPPVSPSMASQVTNTSATIPAVPDFTTAENAPESTSATSEKTYLKIKSPIVGTFYRSSSPDKPPLIKVGDKVELGTVVCIVEAMKLFNEIESEVSGTVVKVMVEDKQPVEYDTVLFLVEQ